MSMLERVALALTIVSAVFAADVAAAQVTSSAADNDMDPSFGDDGWTVGGGAFKVVKRFTSNPSPRPGGGQLDYQPPPDGDAYAGANSVGEALIAKEIAGLTPGTQYVVEWYQNADRVDWQISYRASVYFEVTFCGMTQESHRIAWDEGRSWMAQSLSFTANAPSCSLSFRVLGAPGGGHPSGIGGNFNDHGLLDGVQVSVSENSDFGIAVSGPATADGPATIEVTVSNAGPAEGSPPVVTYRLPSGVSPASESSGALAVSGPDAVSWACVSGFPNSARQLITCTRAGSLAVGSSESFSFAVAFAAGYPGEVISSRLSVGATPYAGNGDPSLDNNSAAFITEPRTVVCGDLLLEGHEACDDGNADAGDGCSAMCEVERGYRCPPVGECSDIDECAEGWDLCFADLPCTNTTGAWTCGCEPGTSGCGAVPVCRHESDGGCDWPLYDCANLASSFLCVCNPEFGDCPPMVCGDGAQTGDENCDDGNMDDGDGCSAECQSEPGWTCSGEPSVCVPIEGGGGASGGSSGGGGGGGGGGGNSGGGHVPRWVPGCSARSGITQDGSIWQLGLCLLGLWVARRRSLRRVTETRSSI
jgi:cysteine-rich repeat protein